MATLVWQLWFILPAAVPAAGHIVKTWPWPGHRWRYKGSEVDQRSSCGSAGLTLEPTVMEVNHKKEAQGFFFFIGGVFWKRRRGQHVTAGEKSKMIKILYWSHLKKNYFFYIWNTEDIRQPRAPCVGLAMMLQYPLVVYLWTPRHPAIWNWFTSAVRYSVPHDIRPCWTELVATPPPTNHIICKCVAPSQPCCRPVQPGNRNESKSSQI